MKLGRQDVTANLERHVYRPRAAGGVGRGAEADPLLQDAGGTGASLEDERGQPGPGGGEEKDHTAQKIK